MAAVGATATVVNFYVTVITGFTLGLTILFAQMFGRGEFAAIPKLLSTFAVFLGGIFYPPGRNRSLGNAGAVAPAAYDTGYDFIGGRILADCFYRNPVPGGL